MNKGIWNRPLLWPGVGAGAMLLAAVGPWPYGYYQLLRLVVCGAGAYFAYTTYQWGKLRAVWVFGAIAVLFNPLLPVHLTREIWAVIDVVCAAAFIAGSIKIDATETSVNHSEVLKENDNGKH